MSTRPRVVKSQEKEEVPDKPRCFVCLKEIPVLIALQEEKKIDKYSERFHTLKSRFNANIVTILHKGKTIYRHAETCEFGTQNYKKFQARKEEATDVSR